jgi:hypothetical protein
MCVQSRWLPRTRLCVSYTVSCPGPAQAQRVKVGNVFGIRAVARRRDGNQTKPLVLLRGIPTVCSTVQNRPVRFERSLICKDVVRIKTKLLSRAFVKFPDVIHTFGFVEKDRSIASLIPVDKVLEFMPTLWIGALICYQGTGMVLSKNVVWHVQAASQMWREELTRPIVCLLCQDLHALRHRKRDGRPQGHQTRLQQGYWLEAITTACCSSQKRHEAS